MPDIVIIQYTGYILLLITFILFLVFNFIFKWNMVMNVLSPLIDKNTDYIRSRINRDRKSKIFRNYKYYISNICKYTLVLST